MATQTITLATKPELLRQLEHMAAEAKEDVETFIIRYLEALTQVRTATFDPNTLPPKTREALGLLKGTPDRPYKELLEEALWEKYMK
jgi:hypothetical protein